MSLSVFVNSGLHGADWPRETHAVATNVFGTERRIDVKNGLGEHCEEALIRELWRVIEDREGRRAAGSNLPPLRKSLKMFISYSPCYDCSIRLIDFIKHADIALEIAFSALCNIHRPSCIRLCRHRLCEKFESQQNIKGLKALILEGVNIHPFTDDDWRELVAALGFSTAVAADAISRRAEMIEDNRMQSDFEELFGKERKSLFRL